MRVEIKVVRENEDGSADADIWLDEEAKDCLIRKAIMDTLVEAAKRSLEDNTPKSET